MALRHDCACLASPGSHHLSPGNRVAVVGRLVTLVSKTWKPSRIAAVCVVAIGLIVEFAWSFAPTHGAWPLIKKLFPTPPDVKTVPPSYQGRLP